MSFGELQDQSPPRVRRSRLRAVVRGLTRWAWDEEIERYVASANGEAQGAKRYAIAKELQLALLEELFREKQGKISRLQAAYHARSRVVYEDLRKENPISKTEHLAQAISVLAERAHAYCERTGKRRNYSDGTVQGVPGDKPNEPTGEGW